MSGDRRHTLRLVEVAGGIGSGKTTLVDTLVDHPMKGVYEDHTINPFWEAFYTDPSSCAFETEVSFLLQHYHFAKRATASTEGVVLLDHSFELDMAYAEMDWKDRGRRSSPQSTGRYATRSECPKYLYLLLAAPMRWSSAFETEAGPSRTTYPSSFSLNFNERWKEG